MVPQTWSKVIMENVQIWNYHSILIMFSSLILPLFLFVFSLALHFTWHLNFVCHWSQMFISLSLYFTKYFISDIYTSWSAPVCCPIMCALKSRLCLLKLLFVMWIPYDTMGQIWVDGTVYHIICCCTQWTHDIYPSLGLNSVGSYK